MPPVAVPRIDYKLIFDGVNEGVLVLNHSGSRIIDANRRVCEIFGYSKEEFKGQKIEIINSDEAGYTTSVAAAHFKRASEGEAQLYEWLARDKKGRLFWVEINLKAATVAPRCCLLAIIRDITEHKKTEKLKDDFISTASHELRTPLSITNEAISLLLDQIPGKLNEQQARIVVTAKNNIDRLARLINDLVDIPSIESGRVELKKEDVDIVELVRQVISDLSYKMKVKKLELKEEFPKKSVLVRVDRNKIARVVGNLLTNAIRFTDKGYIGFSISDKGRTVECSVSDSGIGISKYDLPYAFDKLKQFNRTSGPGEKGLGLGLAIARGLLRLHGGEIRIESEPGVGTKVTFTLPKAVKL